MDSIQTPNGDAPKLSEWVKQVVPTETVLRHPPLLPSAMTSLLKDSENRSLDETVELVEHDETTSARILLWANSASSGAVERITDLKTAIMRVGVGSMVQITLLSKFKSFLTVPLKTYGIRGEDFWMHAFATAVAAESIEADLSFRVSPECFVAGLVHDVGKIFIDRYQEVFASAPMDRIENGDGELARHQREVDMYGLGHATIGASVARHWGFGPTVVDCVAHHHDTSDGNSPEVKVLQLANQIAKSIGRKGGGDLVDDELNQLLRSLQLDMHDYEKIRNRSRNKLTKLAGTLK
jgi:putative nucleotidyltransferase with HDIG domain